MFDAFGEVNVTNMDLIQCAASIVEIHISGEKMNLCSFDAPIFSQSWEYWTTVPRIVRVIFHTNQFIEVVRKE